jgi:hypothetical protein
MADMYILKEDKDRNIEFVTFINNSAMSRTEFKERLKMIAEKYPNHLIIAAKGNNYEGGF